MEEEAAEMRWERTRGARIQEKGKEIERMNREMRYVLKSGEQVEGDVAAEIVHRNRDLRIELKTMHQRESNWRIDELLQQNEELLYLFKRKYLY